MSDEIDFLMHQHQQQTEFQRKQREVRARQYYTALGFSETSQSA